MENERPKLRKKVFTIVEQACHEIHGFKKLYEELQDKILLSGQSRSTLTNYGRKVAQYSFHGAVTEDLLICELVLSEE